MRPSLTVPPVPQHCLRTAASSSSRGSSKGKSNTVVTPFPRLPAVSLPTFTVMDFLAASGAGAASSARAFRAYAAAQYACDEAHDFTLDEAQHFRSVVHVPPFNLGDPSREPFLHERLMFNLLQSNDPIGGLKIFHNCLHRETGAIIAGTNALRLREASRRRGHGPDVGGSPLEGKGS